MGKRHAREERMRGALDAHDHGIESVALRTGVTPATVRRWCAEFDLSPANGADRSAATAPCDDAIQHDPAGGSLDGDRYEEELSDFDKWLEEWLADEEGHKRRLEGMRKVLDEWQAEHGYFTEEELEATRIELYG